MMRILAAALTAAGILVFIGVSYYTGNTGWKYYASKITIINIKVYWLVFILLSLTYILSMIPSNYIPESVSGFLSKIGAYWLSIIIYSFILFLIADVLSLLFNKKNRHIYGKNRINNVALHNMAIIIMIIILSYGIYRVVYPVVTNYSVEIPKSPPNIKSLNIVLVSDIHIGNIIGKENLIKMVDKVNSLKPDIIVICGDIITSNSEDFLNQNAEKILRGLRAKYGVFAVCGNHDYYNKKDIQNKLQCYKNANITILRDNYAKIDNSLYLVGRDDIESKIASGKDRKNIYELLYGLDHTLPIIVLDHQPVDIEDVEKSGADLQLSGHTHGGQTIASGIINRSIYHQLLYGSYRKNNLNVIVTSGFGTWGLPVRTGSRSEIVDIYIKFK